ncbi:hypothetical protein Ciccas_011089 [Cichlidogyrus casuarinus]|uniref:Uncharacterized protein n=1 Tax=Cichlidogyrus casuarinus TaxID=1844966 RepID=A0ABD2PSA9_9PLAT
MSPVEESDSSIDSEDEDMSGNRFDKRMVQRGKYNLVKTASQTSSAYSSMTGPHTLGQKFATKLLQQEVVPTWDFENRELTSELYTALLEQRISINPCNQSSRPSSTVSESDSYPITEKCVLFEEHPACYELNLHAESACREDSGLMISKLARDRIAAVVNLYMTLCQIRSIVTQKNRECTPGSDHFKEADIRRHFHMIQKKRVSVQLVRLGFGLADSE